MTILFWICAVLILYVYIMYPLSLWFICSIRRTEKIQTSSNAYQPSVSVIISARNEARNIEQRIRNFIEQSYPLHKMELIVVSDGSTDETAAIVRSMAIAEDSASLQRIAVIELPDSRGKPHALNLASSRAQNDILVMADARQTFHSDAVSHLVETLGDDQIGCVSGELMLRQSGAGGRTSGVEMGIYWRYERSIRRREAEISSVVGMTGAIYAIRRQIYEAIPNEILIDDLLVPMNVVRRGLRASYNSSAIAYDTVSTSSAQEWQRKVRTMAGNWQLLRMYPWLLSPVHNPIFLQFISHKVGRLIVPFALASTLVSSVAIATPLYLSFAMLQALGLGLGFLGVVWPSARKYRLVSLAYFFLLLNAAAVVGLLHGLRRNSQIVWTDAHKSRS